MTIQDQIKELQRHINGFQGEALDLTAEIQIVKDREVSGKIYGTESDEIRKFENRLEQIREIVAKKRAEIQCLQSQTQQTLFDHGN